MQTPGPGVEDPGVYYRSGEAQLVPKGWLPIPVGLNSNCSLIIQMSLAQATFPVIPKDQTGMLPGDIKETIHNCRVYF